MKAKTYSAISLLTAIFLVSSIAATATASALIPASERGRDRSAADRSPVIEEVDGNLVLTPPGLEKVVSIHYAKPPWAGGGKDKGDGCDSYALLGRGVKWKDLPVDYVIDPDNPDGLTEDFVVNAISASAEEWDANTGAELFGAYSVDYNASWDSDAPDGRNELLFGNYPEDGVIAIAVTWGYFSGPPKARKIIEFDIMFDTDFAWGDATVNPSVMDLQNIATHEIGHGVGLADLYDDCDSEETMHGYSTEG